METQNAPEMKKCICNQLCKCLDRNDLCVNLAISLEFIEMSWYILDAVHLYALPSAPWTATSALTMPFLKANMFLYHVEMTIGKNKVLYLIS